MAVAKQPPVAKRYFFLKKSPKQGLGQSPKVFYRFITTINPEETTE